MPGEPLDLLRTRLRARRPSPLPVRRSGRRCPRIGRGGARRLRKPAGPLLAMRCRMPIKYSIDSALGIVRETWIGVVSAADLEGHWRAMLNDPEVLRLRCTLVDMRPSRPGFSHSEMVDVIRNLIEPALAGRDLRTAVVAFGPTQIGLSERYRMCAKRYSSDATFAEPSAAVEWLRRDNRH